MAGLIILISVIFVGYIVFRLTMVKLLKFILTPAISLLYGFILFFTGMGVGNVFLILAALPVVIGLVLIFKKRI